MMHSLQQVSLFIPDFVELTSEDRHLVQEVMKKYGANHTMTENEVPWSRGRRDVKKRAGNNTFCLLLQPDERTTGRQPQFTLYYCPASQD